jgi:hypothetical protein
LQALHEEAIRAIWLEHDCPAGRDVEFWLKAERQLRTPHKALQGMLPGRAGETAPRPFDGVRLYRIDVVAPQANQFGLPGAVGHRHQSLLAQGTAGYIHWLLRQRMLFGSAAARCRSARTAAQAMKNN